MKISRDEVLRVAELAHLGLSSEEVGKLQADLDGILTYIDKLNELDVSAVEPMTQVLFAASDPQSHPELREDVLLPCEIGQKVLAAAPGAEKPFFRVPKVIER